MKALKCKNCGGFCGPVCKGLGFSKSSNPPAGAEYNHSGHAGIKPNLPRSDKPLSCVHIDGGGAGTRPRDEPLANSYGAKVPVVKPSPAKKGQGGRPRIGTEPETNASRKPWVLRNMSERTWYRREAERRKREVCDE